MPANAHPAAARVHDNGIIHVQSHNSGPANGSQADDCCSRLVPLKMIDPDLSAGVKQGHPFASQRVLRMSGAAFEFVTATTGEAQVVKGRFTALGLGCNMIHCHWLASIGLGSVTIDTGVIVGLKKLVV